MFRYVVLILAGLALSACNTHLGYSFPHGIPTYSGEVAFFQEPLPVELTAFPETPVRLYEAKRVMFSPAPAVSNLLGTMHARNTEQGIDLLAEVPLDGENGDIRKFEIALNKNGVTIDELDFDRFERTASLSNLFKAFLLLPVPEAGYVAGEMYGLPLQNDNMLVQSGFLLRGRTTFRNRDALVFDFRGNVSSSSDTGLFFAGYRIVDIKTGAVIYDEMIQTFPNLFAVHSVIDMDVSSWVVKPADAI